MTMMASSIRRMASGCLVAGLIVLLAGTPGCDGNPQLTHASVSGVVHYQGQPVTGGVLILWSENKEGNQSAQGKIDGNGAYEVLNAPLGKCKVVVNTAAVKHDLSVLVQKTPDAAQGKPPEKTGAPLKYMPLDTKYMDRKTTPIEIVIEKGRQIRDIELP
jgi:hypothetical protein